MRFSAFPPLLLSMGVWGAGGTLSSQTPAKPWAPPSKTEPGLELAVDWKWWVAPADNSEWGMPLPEELRPKPPGEAGLLTAGAGDVRPATYEVKKGDAIIKIAKKFDMTAAQLKQFNELKDDRIKIGQILRIPTPGEVLMMIPPPPPPPGPAKEADGKKKGKKDNVIPPDPVSDPDPGGERQLELENVRLQVFLDREMFSPGIIDGKSGPAFTKICEIYQKSHPDAAELVQLKLKAEAAVNEPYTRYVLRADDFRFIKPPKGDPIVPLGKNPPTSKSKKPKSVIDPPAVKQPAATIDELVATDFLSYSSTWEFVAERFHCSEAFLHHINPQLKGTPVVGSEFQVPNVIPFEIEKALEPPLQPVADPQKPVTAAVVLLSRLEISREGKLIAVMPLASARPGLRGRGSWTILDAIPRPRMATKREPRESPKAVPPSPAGAGSEFPAPSISPPLADPQYLAAGPNNPIGIFWINLAKAGSTEPLPYGLHGTRNPERMKLEGIGGLRLTNWDIARAVRLIPAGTALQWKAQ
jgi:LysM repeat protein